MERSRRLDVVAIQRVFEHEVRVVRAWAQGRALSRVTMCHAYSGCRSWHRSRDAGRSGMLRRGRQVQRGEAAGGRRQAAGGRRRRPDGMTTATTDAEIFWRTPPADHGSSSPLEKTILEPVCRVRCLSPKCVTAQLARGSTPHSRRHSSEAAVCSTALPTSRAARRGAGEPSAGEPGSRAQGSRGAERRGAGEPSAQRAREGRQRGAHREHFHRVILFLKMVIMIQMVRNGLRRACALGGLRGGGGGTGREIEGRRRPEHIVDAVVAEGLYHLGAPLVAPVPLTPARAAAPPAPRAHASLPSQGPHET